MLQKSLMVAMFAVAVSAVQAQQPAAPMTQPTPSSDTQPKTAPATQPVTVQPLAKTKAISGVKEKVIIADVNGAKREVENEFYTFNFEDSVQIVEPVVVLKGSQLANPVFQPGQFAPKSIPALSDRTLLVVTSVKGILTIDESELKLIEGTKIAMGRVYSKTDKIVIVAPPPAVVQLPTQAVVPEGYPLDGKDTTVQFGKVAQEIDGLKVAVSSIKPVVQPVQKLTQTEFDELLKTAKPFTDLKKEVAGMKGDIEALKKAIAAQKKAESIMVPTPASAAPPVITIAPCNNGRACPNYYYPPVVLPNRW